MIVLKDCADWRREFMVHGVPFTHEGNARFFEMGDRDPSAPLIVYDPDRRLLFDWWGGSMLGVYRAPDGADVVEVLTCFQVLGKTSPEPGELHPAGGGWPTSDEIMEAIEAFKES